MIEQKSISSIDKFLGQFMTPQNITDDIVSNIDISNESTLIEPSFGTGNFIKSLKKSDIPNKNIFGCELDESLFDNHGLDNLVNKNFYDYNITSDKPLHFIGNVPFRTPALSLTTHDTIVKSLCKKYRVSGIREEAIFFILKTLELIEKNGKGGRISYIIPKVLLTNNSKFFKTFQSLLDEKFNIINVETLPKDIFDGASLETCLLDMEYDTKTISSFFNQTNDYWNYNEIFNRTYLGSVPCESIFLSSIDEMPEDFQSRLQKLFTEYPNNLDTNLRYNGLAHLKVLNGTNKDLIKAKQKQISDYIENILGEIPNMVEELSDINKFKKINHRRGIRYYYRNKRLKKCGFVYEINPNPCKSFYFTGNPSSTSTDYYGYCDYDITRNSSPGACRTIPLDTLEQNIRPEFKVWWDSEMPDKPIQYLLELFEKTYKSDWYKGMKKSNNRFYFGIPKEINKIIQ